ncbi:hypothetical protein, partial [Vibrio azureus]|uniref:hypothetical protein n=1 Tax=Vibrio azureus TaxID=512649 RepID=UPI001D11DB4F
SPDVRIWLFTDHIKKACLHSRLSSFWGLVKSRLMTIDGVRLMLEYGSSPTTLRKPAYIAGFRRFGA